MSKILVFFIALYQICISPLLHHFGLGGCRYPVSCSSYAKQMIATRGVWRGGTLALKRLSTCHPFAKAAYN